MRSEDGQVLMVPRDVTDQSNVANAFSHLYGAACFSHRLDLTETQGTILLSSLRDQLRIIVFSARVAMKRIARKD